MKILNVNYDDKTTDRQLQKTKTKSILLNDFADFNRILTENNTNPVDKNKDLNITTDSTTEKMKIQKHNTDKSANLLLQGLQLSVFEKNFNRSPISRNKQSISVQHQNIMKNELLTTTIRPMRTQRPVLSISSGSTNNERILGNSQGQGGKSSAGHSIRLIFERAKNRTNDYRVKLQQNKSNASLVAGATAAAASEPKMNTKRNVPASLISNRTLIEEKNLTKVAGFLNNKITLPPNKVIETSTEIIDTDHILHTSSILSTSNSSNLNNNTKIPIYLTKLFKRVVLSDNTKPRNKFTKPTATIMTTTILPQTMTTVTSSTNELISNVKIKPIYHRMLDI